VEEMYSLLLKLTPVSPSRDLSTVQKTRTASQGSDDTFTLSNGKSPCYDETFTIANGKSPCYDDTFTLVNQSINHSINQSINQNQL